MIPSRNSFVRIVVTAALASGLAACKTAAKDEASAAPVSSGIVKEQQVTTVATVQKLDLAKREVTLKGEDGKVFTIHAGDQVKNLPQVKVGDTVSTTYYESIAYEVHKPGGKAEVGVVGATGIGAAKPGEKPAGVAADVIQVTATIVGIDKATPSVTLKRPDGEVVAVRVRDPKKLEGVAVGDLVEITYTQALAIIVEPAKGK
jgi:Cu/Ag efflux protein CusF